MTDKTPELLDMTLAQAAERIGMPSSTVSRLRTMETQVTVGECLADRRAAQARISTVFGIGRTKTAFLLDGVDALADAEGLCPAARAA